MRLDIKDYDCINTIDNEGIIGYSNNIIKLYKDYIKQLIDDMQDETMVCDLTDEVNNCLFLIHNIYDHQNNDNWYEPKLIGVYCNPMGSYEFKELEERK